MKCLQFSTACLLFLIVLLCVTAQSARAANGMAITIERVLPLKDHLDNKRYKIINQENQNQDVVVGQWVKLRGNAARPNGIKWSWEIEGDVVKSYVQEAAKGEVTPLTDFGQRYIDYYYISDITECGEHRVCLSADVKGRYIPPANDVLIVCRPTEVVFSSTTCSDGAAVGIRDAGYGMELYWGNPDAAQPTYGILWNPVKCKLPEINAPRDLTMRLDGAGRIGIVQLTCTERFVKYPTTSRSKSSGGNYWLDSVQTFIWYGARSIGGWAGDTVVLTDPPVHDSPGNPAANAIETSINDDFRSYLMYRPQGVKSIAVTLSVMDWWLTVAAKKGDAGWGAIYDPENPTSPPRYPDDPQGEKSRELPEWDDYSWRHQL